MITTVHLCHPDFNSFPSTELLRKVLGYLDAKRLLSMHFYALPWETDTDQEPTAGFSELTVNKCIKLIETERPCLATMDAFFTPLSTKLAKSLQKVSPPAFCGVEATSFMIGWGPMAVGGPESNRTAFDARCQIALRGDGCPDDLDDYLAAMLSLPEVCQLLAQLREDVGAEWITAISVE